MYAYETQEVQHLSASLTSEWSDPVSVGTQAFCRSFKRMYVSTTDTYFLFTLMLFILYKTRFL